MKGVFIDKHSRQIQLGCGPHPLPSPWENYDQEVNITEPLPFPAESCSYLFAEHVIEHVPYREGLAFLRDCHRCLMPGGVLRLAFPDVTRFMLGSEGALIEERIEPYLRWLEKKRRGLGNDVANIYAFILSGSGHKSAWTQHTGVASLRAAGFDRVFECTYGDSEHSELRNIERHHFSVPESVAIAETTILEAIK